MRLLNTNGLELKEFHGDSIPQYAILSHLWVDGGEEVSFYDFADLSPSTKAKSGFRKIQGACRVARKDGIDWIWIDTNCIDKSSSAELTEAINSMYTWYRDAIVCYAYLADVPHLDLENEKEKEKEKEDHLRIFRQSRWFRRGWTLQELIAPKRLSFYSKAWDNIGDRQDLADEISRITGIEKALLQGLTDLHEVSVAKKMSWAARRVTTRLEDIAYCLLGIFDVNMPLLYGEGTKAFVRLQEEIIKTSNDHTIFCWGRNNSVHAAETWPRMLAPSPAAFLDAGNYVPIDPWDHPMPYSMTNLGLSIHLPVVYTLTQLFVVLDAGLAGDKSHMRACIAMQRTNQRRSGSNILDRSRSIKGPIVLSVEAIDIRERYNLFIRSRHVPFSWDDAHRFYARHFKYGLLLFVDPTATRLLSPGRLGAPLGSMGYDIATHPRGIFDENTALLRLPAFDGGSSLLTSGLMRICFKSPQDVDLYLFFAVISTLGGKEVWYCSVHSSEDFHFIKLAIQENVEEGGAPLQEELLIHSYLRSKAWETHSKQLTAHTADESLFVSIGGTMIFRPETDIRAAMISGKCESPYSVPVSATDLSGIFDEEEDGEYLDSDEDLGDWDSSNEDDKSSEEEVPLKEELPRWDTHSSAESSQALSSS
ncbi:HET-domain-containing protein [Hypoxylon fuscum]|nr:HET-domain-containing protein [Hypoxylon fuscum]